MNFIKSVLSSVVAIFIVIAIFIFIGFGIAASASSDVVKEVKSNSVLNIDLSGELNDFTPSETNPISGLLGIEEKTIGFNNICKAIEVAATDEKIQGISITNLPQNIGWAQATALRKILKSFKDNGKFVYSYSNVYDQKGYYINSIADSIFTSPLGYVELKGLNSEVLFFKSFQEKYGVKMDVIRHGKYKSAVEPFIADEMSEANKKQITELMQSLWSEVHQAITTSRNINVEEAVMNLYGKSSESALAHKLVDGIIYEDSFFDKIKTKIGKEKLEKISITDYITNNSLNNLSFEKNKIAVVYAQGEIIYGKGNLNVIGQEKMIKALHKAATNKNVKAIVLRVNSPGGSALASDLIWRAVEKAKEKKPVVVSMGNYAASGGYYIACGANRIFAEPTTITGSIGVFGMLPNAAKLAKNMGINSQVVSTHNNGMHYSVLQPADERFKNTVKNGIEVVYDNFLDRVSKGRNMTKTQVDEIAQGRVWTGAKALEVGLVDELGSLDNAIAYAANLTNTENFSVKEYPEFDLDFKEMLGFGSFMSSKNQIHTILKNTGLKELTGLQEIMQAKGLQARIPFQMNVE